jgi:cytochrome c oxidase subunit 4
MNNHAAAPHVVSWRLYLAVFAALYALTILTVLSAGHDFGPFNLIAVLGIAITKSSLVVLYFMHARYSGRLTAVVIAAAIVFFVILVFLTMTDYWSRAWLLTAG